MKLLFLENRYKTFFFQEIVKDLIKEHEIFWIVQNSHFSPHIGQIFTIPFPKYKANSFSENHIEINYDKIIESDRQINFFEKKEKKFLYYYASQIDSIISEIKPDFVFGESTAFHELLAIEICKKRDILYLNPSSCRYPQRRFSFYKYDTLDPHLGSGEVLSKENALSIIDQIINKETAPDYMKPRSFSKTKVHKDQMKKIISYLSGERYNTPSPLVKYKIEKAKKHNINIWESSAISEIKKDEKIKVLYPLQMQPEANIDVWGRKWRNQTDLIYKMVKLLPEDCELYIKPNPKSKYELSQDLIEICKKDQKIVQLSHELKMKDVFNYMDLVVTVTGTIAIECILSNKPVLTLVETLNNNCSNCIYIQELVELVEYIDKVKANTFPVISEQAKIDFLNELNSTSYRGIVSDQFSDPLCMHEENIDNLYKAFKKIMC